MKARACLGDDTIAAYTAGDLPPASRDAAERHLHSCNDCALLLSEHAKFLYQTHDPRSGETEAEGGDEATPGSHISRYAVAGLVDRGGAGAVYEAFDPQLKRKVAVKLLRRSFAPDAHSPATEIELSILLREAEAMARLAHPHVVTVYDAGLSGGRVFIVMELVDGESLATWLRGARGEAEIVARLVEAGRGLEAAHAAGIVHGDFKPQNVIVGRDGRTRVTDFGLARAVGDGPVDVSASTSVLTGGTPLFMAPEQLRGRAPTLASDQFSFALTLYRALCHKDPFGLEVRTAWARGPAVSEPGARALRSTRLPRRAQDAILRALAPDPDDRWPTLAELLAALGPRRADTRRMALATAAAAVVLVGGTAWAIVAAPRAVCGDGIVGGEETCDDGNASNDDACLATCQPARCGDGVVRAGVEDCDEGGAPSPGCQACQRCEGGEAAFLWPANGHCYTRHAEALTWNEAAGVCAARGGALVGYASGGEAVEVTRALMTTNETGQWLGLRRLRAELGFQWSGGDAWFSTMSGWWSNVHAPAGEDCVYQRPGEIQRNLPLPARWPTASCDERRPFICERAPWQTRGRANHAYRVFLEKVTWDDARRSCEAIGARLSAIESPEEQAALAEMSTVDVWIGARAGAKDRRFAWWSGTPVGYAAFAPGEPDAQESPACAILGTDERWHDRGCTHEHFYLCERE